jgi:hypothetical protein
MSVDPCIIPESEWPREIDERVLIFVVHPNAAFARADDLANWMGWFQASWTDFNGGGWVWHGMIGAVTHVRPMPPVPDDALAIMLASVASPANVVPIRRRQTPEGWG